MRKYKQTPWIDKVIEEYKGVGKEQEYYVQTMAIAELIALTKAKQQLQSEQQAHNALREKLKNVDPWVWDGSSREYFCVFCTARYNPTIKEDFIHDEDVYYHKQSRRYNSDE